MNTSPLVSPPRNGEIATTLMNDHKPISRLSTFDRGLIALVFLGLISCVVAWMIPSLTSPYPASGIVIERNYTPEGYRRREAYTLIVREDDGTVRSLRVQPADYARAPVGRRYFWEERVIVHP